SSDLLMRIDSISDIDRVKSSGKTGILLGVQNAEHFTKVEDVDDFYGLGQRISQLTYNTRNRIGNGCTERVDGGISDFGFDVIKRMNEVGMAVDVSHCGDRTTMDAFEASSKPVLVTHSNARALNDHVRCKTDEALKAMAKSGGAIGITGMRNFVKATDPTTIEDVLNHFDYVARLIGVEHVGVGSDIDLYGYDALPADELAKLRSNRDNEKYKSRERSDIDLLNHPKRMFDLTEGLIERGYSDRDLSGILGGHFKRALSEIWKA
ncbi:MAG: membrane dipeptidase, partial [Cyclobacteriaceae bacterium]